MKTRSFVTLGAACLLALTACSGSGDTNAQNTASASSPHQSSSASRSALEPRVQARNLLCLSALRWSMMTPPCSLPQVQAAPRTPRTPPRCGLPRERSRRVRSLPHRLTQTRVIPRTCAVQGRLVDPLASRVT